MTRRRSRGVDWRAVGVIAVGVVLLLSPVFLSGVTLGAQTNHYSAAHVTVDDGNYTVSGMGYGNLDADVLCWGSLSRGCQLERSLVNGSISAEHGPVYYDRLPDYSYVYHDGTFYEPTHETEALGLVTVDTATAIESVADPSSTVPSGVASALRDGESQIATHASIPEHHLIDLGNDEYAMLAPTYQERKPVDEFLFALNPVLAPGGFLLGLLLVLWGQRSRYV